MSLYIEEMLLKQRQEDLLRERNRHGLIAQLKQARRSRGTPLQAYIIRATTLLSRRLSAQLKLG
jgi:hypothetical protein